MVTVVLLPSVFKNGRKSGYIEPHMLISHSPTWKLAAVALGSQRETCTYSPFARHSSIANGKLISFTFDDLAFDRWRVAISGAVHCSP